MNKIYAIIGPHASGKKKILHHLRMMGISYIISHTTRKPRSSEKNGFDYHFVTKEEFFKLDLVEKTTYKGEYYGISKTALLSAMQVSEISLVLVEQNGFKQLQKLLGQRIESIFIMVDYVTMVENMLANNESNELMKSNLEYAEKNGEFMLWKTTDYVVKNKKDINVTLNQILSLMGFMERKKEKS